MAKARAILRSMSSEKALPNFIVMVVVVVEVKSRTVLTSDQNANTIVSVSKSRIVRNLGEKNPQAEMKLSLNQS